MSYALLDDRPSLLKCNPSYSAKDDENDLGARPVCTNVRPSNANLHFEAEPRFEERRLNVGGDEAYRQRVADVQLDMSTFCRCFLADRGNMSGRDLEYL